MIINAGSENTGGTLAQAYINANKWLQNIHDEGFLEVVMEYHGRLSDGNYLFHFVHNITKQVSTLGIHGFTDEECNNFTFQPRVYWNYSSTGQPKAEDWLDEGFKYRIEYYKSKKTNKN